MSDYGIRRRKMQVFLKNFRMAQKKAGPYGPAPFRKAIFKSCSSVAARGARDARKIELGRMQRIQKPVDLLLHVGELRVAEALKARMRMDALHQIFIACIEFLVAARAAVVAPIAVRCLVRHCNAAELGE